MNVTNYFYTFLLYLLRKQKKLEQKMKTYSYSHTFKANKRKEKSFIEERFYPSGNICKTYTKQQNKYNT